MKFKIDVKYSAYLPNRSSKTTLPKQYLISKLNQFLATLENIQFRKASQDKDDYKYRKITTIQSRIESEQDKVSPTMTSSLSKFKLQEIICLSRVTCHKT